MEAPRTLFDKLWQRHLGDQDEGGDAARKHRLLQGLDDIALTLRRADRIRAFEAHRRVTEPWLFN